MTTFIIIDISEIVIIKNTDIFGVFFLVNKFVEGKK